MKADASLRNFLDKLETYVFSPLNAHLETVRLASGGAARTCLPKRRCIWAPCPNEESAKGTTLCGVATASIPLCEEAMMSFKPTSACAVGGPHADETSVNAARGGPCEEKSEKKEIRQHETNRPCLRCVADTSLLSPVPNFQPKISRRGFFLAMLAIWQCYSLKLGLLGS